MDVKSVTYWSLQFSADEESAERLMDELAPLRGECIRVRSGRDYPIPAGDHCMYDVKGWTDPCEGTSPRMVEVILSPASLLESSRKTLIDFDELVRRYEKARPG